MLLLSICNLDLARFHSGPGLTWTVFDVLLITESGIGSGIVILFFAKANNRYMKNWNQNEDFLYLIYLEKNNLYGMVKSQKPFADGFR